MPHTTFISFEAPLNTHAFLVSVHTCNEESGAEEAIAQYWTWAMETSPQGSAEPLLHLLFQLM